MVSRTESDHFPLLCYFNGSEIRVSEDDGIVYQFDRYRWKPSNSDIFLKSLSVRTSLLEMNDFSALSNKHTGEAANKLINIVQESGKEANMLLRKHDTKNICEVRHDHECKDIKKRKYSALDKFRVTGNFKHLTEFRTCRNKYRELCRRKCELYHESTTKQLLQSCKDGNYKTFWSGVKSLLGKSVTQATSISSLQWVDYFKNILNIKDVNIDEDFVTFAKQYILQNASTLIDDDSDNILNKEITLKEITIALSALKLGKACGPDGLPPEMWKHGGNILLPYLHVLFNCIFNSGDFPSAWSQSIIFPLHKKGSKHDVNNYRGISLMDICGKIFTYILNERLKTFVNVYNLNPECQTRYPSGYSTVDCMFSTCRLSLKILV